MAQYLYFPHLLQFIFSLKILQVLDNMKGIPFTLHYVFYILYKTQSKLLCITSHYVIILIFYKIKDFRYYTIILIFHGHYFIDTISYNKNTKSINNIKLHQHFYHCLILLLAQYFIAQNEINFIFSFSLSHYVLSDFVY